MRKYGYKYDEFSRLTHAFFQKPYEAVPITHSYDEEIDYDANGNIQNIYRNGDLESPSGVIKIDELKYSYEQYSNKLLAVEDQQNDPSGFSDGNLYGDDYTYDDDGNMTSDGNKQIYQITYNHLNLPLAINFGNGSYIKYVYDAQGVKVRKLVSAMQADTSQHQTKTLNRRCQKADTM